MSAKLSTLRDLPDWRLDDDDEPRSDRCGGCTKWRLGWCASCDANPGPRDSEDEEETET